MARQLPLITPEMFLALAGFVSEANRLGHFSIHASDHNGGFFGIGVAPPDGRKIGTNIGGVALGTCTDDSARIELGKRHARRLLCG